MGNTYGVFCIKYAIATVHEVSHLRSVNGGARQLRRRQGRTGLYALCADLACNAFQHFGDLSFRFVSLPVAAPESAPYTVKVMISGKRSGGVGRTILASLATLLFFFVGPQLSPGEHVPGRECESLGTGHWNYVAFEVPLEDVPRALIDDERRLAAHTRIGIGFRYNPCGGIRNTLVHNQPRALVFQTRSSLTRYRTLPDATR